MAGQRTDTTATGNLQPGSAGRGQGRRHRRPVPGPTRGAVVLSVDEKTQLQALDRTQPLLPISVGAAEKRTHDYVRHGTTNRFAALNVTSGDVYGECHPARAGASFLSLPQARCGPARRQGCPCRAGQFVDAHHTRCRGLAEANPQVHFHFTPVGAPWINQIEAWFSTLTRQSIRRGTFTSVQVLVTQIRDYITRWNSNPKPFVWTATADEILAKVRLVQANVRKLVDNNA